MIPSPLYDVRLATLLVKRYQFELMNNPYASPQYAPPAGGFGAPTGGGYGAPTGDPMYRQESPGGQATEASVDFLRQTKPWVTFLSVMGFIGSGFMLLAGVFMMIAGAIGAGMGGSGAGAFPGVIMGLVYIPVAFVYIYPSLKLWGYSGAIGRLLNSRSTTDLEAALSQQKSFWKFIGIFTVVSMVLYGLMFAGMMVFGLAAASRVH